MTVELAALMGLISGCIGIASFVYARKKDNDTSSREMAKVLTKLDVIDSGVQRIENEVKSVKQEVKDLEHRVTVLETKNELCSKGGN